MKTFNVIGNQIKIVSLIFLLVIVQSGIAQPIWSKLNLGGQFIEDYDKGYVFADGLLIKTDINGNEKYRIFLEDSITNQKIYLISILNADSNSIIAGGYKTINSSKYSPFICKFDKCKQIEWYKTIDLPSIKMFCKEIISTSDNNYYCLLTSESRYEKDVYIIKLNSLGKFRWANRYCNNSTYDSIHYTHILKDDNEGIILSGTTDFRLAIPDFGNHAQRPFWIKIDSAGNQQFDTIFNPGLPNSEFRSGVVHKGIINAHGTMNYGGGSGFFDPVNDGFYKINRNDFTIQWHPIANNHFMAMPDWQTKTLVQINDKELIMASSRQDHGEHSQLALFKTDTVGNINGFYYDQNSHYNANNILLTTQNQILISGTASTGLVGGPIIFVPSTQKFNLDFNGGIPDMNEYNYDSLCSVPIISDTILIKSNHASLSIPFQQNQTAELQLNIFPNPATTFVTIEIPEFSISNTSSALGMQQQYRLLTGEVQLSYINLNGQTIKTELFDASERNHVVNITHLASGLYILHLTQKGKIVAQGKVMVVR